MSSVTRLARAFAKGGKATLRWSAVTAGHHYPFYRGSARLANTRPLRWLADRQEVLVEARLRNGTRLFVRLDDFVGRSIFYFGDLDRRITWVCTQVLRPGDTVVDIGANYGLVTMMVAPIVGATGRIHAFEPQPALVALLRSSLDANGVTQATVHDVALSDVDGVAQMWVPLDNGGAASLGRHGASDGLLIDVPVRNSGSCLLKALGDTQARLMKLDVEGHESAVIRGAADYLREHGPELILFEWNDGKIPLTHADVGRVLWDLEYEIYELVPSMGRTTLELVSKEHDPEIGGRDYVALRAGPSRDNLRRALGVVSP